MHDRKAGEKFSEKDAAAVNRKSTAEAEALIETVPSC